MMVVIMAEMEIQTENINGRGIRFSVKENNLEIGRAYLYLLKNDLHDHPFGFIEDVFIEESKRGNNLGTELVKEIIKKARDAGCYKIICTSRNERFKIHEFYQKAGFKDYGKEFRIDLK